MEIHLTAHSAGARLILGMAAELTRRLEVPVETVQLAAPAVTMPFLRNRLETTLGEGMVGQLAVYNLTTAAEHDDTYEGYGKSLLYLVQNALEPDGRGHGLAGLHSVWQRAAYRRLSERWTAEGKLRYILSPNDRGGDSPDASNAAGHGEMAYESTLVGSMLRRVADRSAYRAPRPLR